MPSITSSAVALSTPDLSQIPAMPPPPGVTSNFVDPEDITYQITIVGAVMLTLSTIATMLRFYVKGFLTRNIALDDWLGLAGYIMAHTFTGYCLWLFQHREFGRHMWDVPASYFLEPRPNLFKERPLRKAYIRSRSSSSSCRCCCSISVGSSLPTPATAAGSFMPA